MGLFCGWLWPECVRLEASARVKRQLRKSRIWSTILLYARSRCQQNLSDFQKFRTVQTKQVVKFPSVCGTRTFCCRLCRTPPQTLHWSQKSLIHTLQSYVLKNSLIILPSTSRSFKMSFFFRFFNNIFYSVKVNQSHYRIVVF